MAPAYSESGSIMVNTPQLAGSISRIWRPLAGASQALRIRLVLGGFLTLLFAIVYLAQGQSLLGDPDTLWHITVGKDIWASKSFPIVDAYSHTFTGETWIAKEWLSQLILYTAYAMAGWNGVVLLTVSIVLTVMWQLYWPLSGNLKPLTAIAITAAAIALCSAIFVARPHIVVLPLVLFIVHRLWVTAQNKRAPSFWLLGGFCLWANMHGTFVFGYVAAFAAFVLYLHETRDLKSVRTMAWLGFLALCPLTAIIHPYGIKSIWSTITIAQSEALPYISEWRAFSAPEDWAVEIVLLGLVALALVSRFRTNIVTALFICLLVHMYFTHVRLVYLLALLTPLLVMRDVANQFPAVSFEKWAGAIGDSPDDQAMARAAPIIAPAMAGLLVVIGALTLGFGRWSPPPSSYPIKAIEAARASGVTGNVLNEYNFGGALIFEGIPTFIDGRADWLFQDGFIPNIERTENGDGDIFREQIEKYDIGWSLLKPTDGRIALMDQSSRWMRIYEDEFVVVHKARDERL